MSRKILAHPDKEEIIRKLTDGESVRTMEAWLKAKYPNKKSLHLSHVSLQNYRKANLNLHGKVLGDIQEAKAVEDRKVAETMRQRQLEATNAYQDKINSIASEHLDVTKQIIQLNTVVEKRIEYWYNMIESGEELPAKADVEMRKYIDQQISILQQWKKLVEGMADKTVDYNVNITVFNDQISIIRDVIKETVAELGPEQGITFMDKLSKRLGQTFYRPAEQRKEPVDVKQLQDLDYQLLSSGEYND